MQKVQVPLSSKHFDGHWGEAWICRTRCAEALLVCRTLSASVTLQAAPGLDETPPRLSWRPLAMGLCQCLAHGRHPQRMLPWQQPRM